MSSLRSKALTETKPCSICGAPSENLQEPILCDFCIEELDKLFEQQRDELWRDSYELAEL